MIPYFKLIPVLFFILFGLQACNTIDIPKAVENVIQKAGANKETFIAVIKHYSKHPVDSLKLKAAYFLIINMDGLFYYDGELLNQYQQYLKLIRCDKEHGEYFMRSFNMLYGPFSYGRLEKKYDLKEITAAHLINNIDVAFKVWQGQPWSSNYSFDEFCEYILSYRIANEMPAYNREEIYKIFSPLLASTRYINRNVLSAAQLINSGLAKTPWLFSLRSTFLPHYPASSIIKYRAGSCREMTDLAFYTMRSVGIPVAIDFVPQWPYRSMGHEFNSLLNEEGKSIIFLGTEDNPGTPHKPLTKKAKVYRHWYSINQQSLGILKDGGESIPPLLKDARLKDVTDEYTSCFDIEVTLDSLPRNIKKFKHAYIAVFNNKDWIPIDWGNVVSNKVKFKKMEGGIVYIAGYYDNDSFIPATHPFVLTEQGLTEFLEPNISVLNSKLILDRIFPIIPDFYNTWNISGGIFQGANKLDFSDSEKLYTVAVRPNPGWNKVAINATKTFRYVRFLSIGTTNISEIEFYSSGKKLQGNPFGSKTGWYQDKTFDKAFDNNIFTGFDASGVGTDSTWLGLDFKKSKRVDQVRFCPTLDDAVEHKIIDGHTYELLYWSNGNWLVTREQKAVGLTELL